MQTLESIIFVVVLIFSVVLHELAHGYAADSMGDSTPRMMGRLTLNPIPHLDLFGSVILPALLVLSGTGIVFGWAKPVPFNPANIKSRWGGALVALAGPLTNICLVLIFSGIIRLVAGTAFFSPELMMVLGIIVLVNIVLAIFNLIPIPPLDGHHVLFAFIPERYRPLKDFLRKYAMIILIVGILLFANLLSPVFIIVFEFLTGIPLIA